MSVRNLYPQQRPTLNLNFAQSKILDPRITFTRTSTATYVDEDGLIKIADADVARFDHDPVTGECLGLLIEESRTNDIRNNTMQGAVAGTPGTAPTNWVLGTSVAGFTREITDVGVENGIQYVDIRWYGTATGNPFSYLAFWPDGSNTTNSPGTYTSRYTFSSYVKVVSGTVPSSTTFILVMTNADSGSIGLNEYKLSTIISNSSVPTGNLIDNRFALTNTDFSNTNTAYFKPYYQWNVPNGTSMDVTVRIGLPQMEEGSFMTSVIPTINQGKSRSPDSVSMTGDNFSDWYNPTEGTILSIFNTIYEGSLRSVSTPGVWGLSQSVSENNVFNGYGLAIRADTRKFSYAHRVIIDAYNVNVSLIPGFEVETIQPYTKYKVSCSYANNELKMSSTGQETLTRDDANYGLLPKTTLFIGNQRFGGSPPYELTGHISKLTYYPVRLSNDQLQSLTK